MIAYAKNMQLALSDRFRRAGLAAGAGLMMAVAVGFLMAALWTYLADHLHWGSMLASLAIGGGLVVIGLICLMMAKRERHRTPTTEELRTEVAEQLNVMTNAAINRASDAADLAFGRVADKAGDLLNVAENKAHSVADDLSYRANRFADQAEAKVYGTARGMGEAAASKLGISPHLVRLAGAKLGPERVSNAAAIAPLLGAFAVGITLASRLQEWRHRDDAATWEDEDWRPDERPDDGANWDDDRQ